MELRYKLILMNILIERLINRSMNIIDQLYNIPGIKDDLQEQ